MNRPSGFELIDKGADGSFIYALAEYAKELERLVASIYACVQMELKSPVCDNEFGTITSVRDLIEDAGLGTAK